MNIGEPKRMFEVEPLTLPIPELLPDPGPAPITRPEPERDPAAPRT